MLRACVLSGVVLGLVGAAPTALASEVVSPQARVAVPPALQALEQKMQQINFNTARFSTRFGLGELGSPANGAELGSNVNVCKSLVTSSTGIERLSPPASVSVGEFDGVVGSKSKELSIGNTIYVFTPSASRSDGGRPWVRSAVQRTPKSAAGAAFGSALAPAHLASGSDGSEGHFAKLIEETNGALSIQEVGPATVDGQEVTEFTASLSLTKLITRQELEEFTGSFSSLNELLAPKPSPKQREEAKKHQEEATQKLSEAPMELELFIPPNGIPVRTTVVIGKRSEGIGAEQDILAVGVPVVVHAPPVDKTIGQAQLRKAEQQRFKRELRQLRKRIRSGKSVRLPKQSPSPISAPSKCPSEASEGSGGISSSGG
jgi:hypothetical protein